MATPKWEIPCLNCGGKGWTNYMRLDGVRKPRRCRGCGGSGKQAVT